MVVASLISMVRGDTNLGSVNGYVALLQRFLVMNGVLTSSSGMDPVNGKFDDATESAVRSFQSIYPNYYGRWRDVGGARRSLNTSCYCCSEQ